MSALFHADTIFVRAPTLAPPACKGVRNRTAPAQTRPILPPASPTTELHRRDASPDIYVRGSLQTRHRGLRHTKRQAERQRPGGKRHDQASFHAAFLRLLSWSSPKRLKGVNLIPASVLQRCSIRGGGMNAP